MLTVYGIETHIIDMAKAGPGTALLQQCLPFTVLKPLVVPKEVMEQAALQQCLPFTVLKHIL